MAKLVTVFGATGQQGGALIDHILGNRYLSSVFKLRGITRDSSKPAAVALRERGVEIIEADLNKESTLIKAVSGSHAVFAVTNFWEQASADIEIAQGKAIADAAIADGVTQIIWSSLPSGKITPEGESTAPKHFVSKAEVETYIRTLDIKSMFFMPGWFMQNHLYMMRPRKAEDSTYVFSQPWALSTKLPLIDIRDAGKFIAPALLNPDVYNGNRFTCATSFYSLTEMTDTWTKVTGKVVKLQVDHGEDSNISEEQRKEVKKGGDALVEFGYFGPTGEDDLLWTQNQLTEKLRTWEEFVLENQPWFP